MPYKVKRKRYMCKLRYWWHALLLLLLNYYFTLKIQHLKNDAGATTLRFAGIFSDCPATERKEKGRNASALQQEGYNVTAARYPAPPRLPPVPPLSPPRHQRAGRSCRKCGRVAPLPGGSAPGGGGWRLKGREAAAVVPEGGAGPDPIGAGRWCPGPPTGC